MPEIPSTNSRSRNHVANQPTPVADVAISNVLECGLCGVVSPLSKVRGASLSKLTCEVHASIHSRHRAMRKPLEGMDGRAKAKSKDG